MFLYQGSPSTPLQPIDSTFQGGGDSSGKVGGTLYYPGQILWAVWIGGDPGAIGTLQVYGQQATTGDPLEPGPVGAGFTAQTLSPTQITNFLISSSLSTLIASAIQLAGVPPIDHPAAVSTVFNQAIAAGASWTSSRLSVAQYQSLVGTMFAQEQTGGGLGTNPYMRMQLDWSLVSDSYDTLIQEDWVGGIGPASFVNNYRHDYASPCYGDTLTLTVHNYDNKPIIFTYGLFGSYRTRVRSVLRGTPARARWPSTSTPSPAPSSGCPWSS